MLNLDRSNVLSISFSDLLSWDFRSNYLNTINRCEWPTRRIDEIAKLRQDAASSEEIATRDVLLLDRISFDEGKIFAGSRTNTKMRQFKAYKGDIVISKINARKGAIGIVDIDKPVSVTVHFRVLIPDKTKFRADFLKLALRSSYCKNQFEIETGGQGKGEISESRLLAIKVPVPSLPIQQKIVAYWRKAQNDIVYSIERAESLPDILENDISNQLGLKKKRRLRQPKITIPSWSTLNKWSQRATHLFNQIPDLSKAKFPIAKGFDCITEVKHGCSASPSRKPTSLSVLKLSAVTGGFFQPLECKFIQDNKKFRENFDLRINDILICRTNGSLSLVGRPVKIDKDWPDLIFPDKLMRIRCNEKTLPDFLSYILTTSLVRPQIEAYARTAVGNYAIGHEDVLNLLFPLPPIPIQKKLIDIISERKSEYKELKEEAEAIREKSKKRIEKMILGLRPVEDI